MANSKRFAEKARTLTESQLFRIANYVPDNAEMYDDASIASIYGQIRAAQNELERRRRKTMRRNPPGGGRGDARLHHYFEESLVKREGLLSKEQNDRRELAEKALGRVLVPVDAGDAFNAARTASIGNLKDAPYAFQFGGVPGFIGDYIIMEVVDGKPRFVTIYATPEHLYNNYDGTYAMEQTTIKQMVPDWNTVTLPWESYMPRRTSDGRFVYDRASGSTSALYSNDRQKKVQTGIQHILANYAAEGPMRWQRIWELSNRIKEEHPNTAGGTPYTPGEVAEGIRRCLDADQVRIDHWVELNYPSEDGRKPKGAKCTSKWCEPFFVLGSRSTIRPAPSAKKNPKGDALDGLRQEYGRLRSKAINLALRHNYATTRDPEKLRAAFDEMVENVRRENGVEKTPEGYVMAAHWALNMIKVTTLV